MTANRVLPDARTLVRLYASQGRSYGEIGKMYGVGPDAVRQTMTRDARRLGTPWPLKKGRPNARVRMGAAVGRVVHDSVTAVMVRAEINEQREQHGTTLRQIAELSGVDYWTVARVASGSKQRIARRTAEAIMIGIVAIERRQKISEGRQRQMALKSSRVLASK